MIGNEFSTLNPFESSENFALATALVNVNKSAAKNISHMFHVIKVRPYLRLHMIIYMPKISHYSIFYILRYAHVRYVKCLFTNIQKQ